MRNPKPSQADQAGQARVKALQRILAAEAAKNQGPNQHQAATRATPKPKPTAAKPAQKPAKLGRPKSAAPSHAKAKNEGTDLARALAALDPSKRAAILALFRAHSGHPEAVDLLDEAIPRIWTAMVVGACKPGIQGVADRTALFKIMGLPWAAGGARTGQAGSTTVVIGERLALALARSGRANGQSPVTLTSNRLTDAQFSAEIEGDAPKIMDQVRYSDTSSAAADLDLDDDLASLEGE